MGIFPLLEKSGDTDWWNERGKRGGDHTHVREILHATEEKSIVHEREKRYEKRGEEKNERVQK